MNARIFHIVDVFAETKFTGNQLAVCLNAGDLTDEQMQGIAKEMHFSETTFIVSDSRPNGGYDVRIFTPKEEVPFAGHPTLGTAYVIQREVLQEPVEQVLLNLTVGQIPVTFTYDGDEVSILWMQQKEATFGQQLDPKNMAEVLGLRPADLDERFPVEEVSTGLPHIVIPLKTLAGAKRIQVARDKYFALIEQQAAKSILVFCPETYQSQNQVNVRVFAEYYNVPEDPATGSGNGCLAGYLVKHHYWGSNQIDVRSEQGYEIDRPSLLLLQAQESGGQIAVAVGGKVIPIARGEFV